MTIDTSINTNTKVFGGDFGRLHSDQKRSSVQYEPGQGVGSQKLGDAPSPKGVEEFTDVYLPDSYQAALDSIFDLLSSGEMGSEGEEEVLLAKLAEKIRTSHLRQANETANLTRAQREAASSEVKAIMEKIEEQQAEAEKKAEEAKKAGRTKRILSIVAFVATALLAVVTLGALAALVAIAASAFLLANDISQDVSGKSLISHTLDGLPVNLSDKQRQNIEMAVVVVVSVVALVASCGGPLAMATGAKNLATAGFNMGKAGINFMSGGAKAGQTANVASKGQKSAEVATKLTEAEKTAKLAADTRKIEESARRAEVNAQRLHRGANGFAAASMTAEGGATVGESVIRSQAMNIQAKTSDLQGELEEDRAFIEALDLLIKEYLEDAGQAMLIFAENIGTASDGLAKKGDVYMHVGNNIGRLTA